MYNGISLILILPYKKVSWIRNKDGYMLYIGTTKFVDDDRFDLLPGNENQADLSTSKGGVDVTLRLRRVKDIDQGNFECQISTEPKLSKIFTLNVIGEYNMISLNILSSLFKLLSLQGFCNLISHTTETLAFCDQGGRV